MKFNLIAIAALVGLAAAATETTTSNDATITLSPEAKCANRCDSANRCCIASCYRVPCPSDSQANDTNRCVANCPQGNGSAADSEKFADCEQACYSSHFFPASAYTSATETGSSGTIATGVRAAETGTSTGFQASSNGATRTSDSMSGSSTGAIQTGAAANVKLGSSGAGLFGLALAAFAL